MNSSAPKFAYKVVTGPVWQASKSAGILALMPVDEADGYIHMSTADQLRETLRLYFAGQSGLVLFSVEPARFGEAIKWEPSRGGVLFPHLYGELPLDAVIWSAKIDVAEDGTVELPEAVQ